ncbi:MAG: hypothetical protein ABI040_02720, partial [Rhodoferax sp.]
MKMKSKAIVGAITLGLTGLLSAPTFAATNYKFEKIATIKLGGAAGHGDLLSLDPATHRIFIAMHDKGVSVVDTQTNKLIKYIPDVPSPNGSALDGHDLYVAAAEGAGAGKVNAIIIIDTQTLKIVGRFDTKGTSPDWVAVNPATHTLYVTSDDNNWDEIYDVSDPTKPVYKAGINLYPSKPVGGPDVGTLVPDANTIYQADDSYVLKINTTTGEVDKHFDTSVKIGKTGGTKASYLDSKNKRLWVATTNHPNPGVFVLTPDLAVIKTLPESGGVDDAQADPELGLLYLYSTSSKGFDVYDINAMTHLTHVSTGDGNTHTGMVDPATHLVY